MTDEKSRSAAEPEEMLLPVLPLRNSVLFPQVVIPLAVGRPKSIRLIEDAVERRATIAIVTQRRQEVDDPTEGDIYALGTSARILKVVKIAGDNYSVIIQGQSRIRLKEVSQEEPFMQARFEVLPEDKARTVEVEALFRNLKDTAKEVVKFIPEMPKEAGQMVDSVDEPGQLCDFVAANMDIPTDEKQKILETVNLKERLEMVVRLLVRQLEVLKVSDKIQTQIKEEIDKNQREYYLRQQLKAIKDQLGDLDSEGNDLEEIARAIEEKDLPEEVNKQARKQLDRLRLMQPASSEYGVTRTYLETLLDLPWSHGTQDNLDITASRAVLDEDHYGLERVKKRIIEYLAVRKLKQDMKGPILCLAGPPGVGKTSLGRSVARALGRKFVRISLGGVHDESEIRGHRRTYVGALPGRIIQGLRKAGTNNPVFMLDEIDKIGRDFRGDPSSALLEVLDPEQNSTFSDHYIEVPVDLSKILFIATANVLDTISAPLRDRMEVIEIPGYTAHEKEAIARQYLVPKQLEGHGITTQNAEIRDDVLKSVINAYTREAGVRNLERNIADICRGVAVKVAIAMDTEGAAREDVHVEVNPDNLSDFLGPERFQFEVAERTAEPGVATGLAWTAAGGDILFIESTKMPGKGNLVLTGQLGDVMKESVKAALSYIRSHSFEFDIDHDFMNKFDIHLHVPAGAIPKDGPSAGITMFTSMISLIAGIKVRNDTAMTGEITLRGNILPVGGIKEKVLAAHRAGITRVILPTRCQKDLVDVADEIKKEMEFLFVSRIEELIPLALERDPRTEEARKESEERMARFFGMTGPGATDGGVPEAEIR
jgi:ATP-dependent Lon protease